MRALFFTLAAMTAIGCHDRVAKMPPAALSATVTVTSSAGLEARLSKVEAILEEQRQEQHIPGLAFAIVKDDQVVYLKAFGLRDVERALPATADTLFPIGSCTKAFTSMAVGISQDEGTLSLDDPPRKYLPYFKLADPDADARVTLRDMLSHQTGLKAYADLAAEPAILTREEYVRAATSAKPTAKLRAAFQYSNAMFSAAGEIVGKANGSTWERVVEARIFGPLGMTSSITAMRDMAKTADHVTGYVYVNESKTFRPVPPLRWLEALGPAGSIASSARDMTQWLRMLSARGRIGGKRIVSEAMFRDLTTAHIPINASMSYALGWATYDWNGLRVVEHNGGSDGLSALVSFIPDRRVGFVFLANTSRNFMTQIGNAGKLLWPLILGEDARASVPPAGSAGPHPADAQRPADDAAKAAGPVPPAAAVDLPSVDALLSRMVRAAGGERSLRRHTSLEIHALKSYANQGVTADLTVRAKAPGMRAEEEVLSAAGKEIGRVRVYFDGVRGGQEMTFDQDSLNDDPTNDRARRDNNLHPLLDLKRLYKDVHVQTRAKVGAEDTYVLQLVPATGKPVLLYVSARTARVVQREAEGESMIFDDYRAVDGELVPFRTTIQDALGETTVQVQDVRFNAAIADTAFAPLKARP